MKEELIGKTAQVVFNEKKHHGEIIDETKNMIHLKTKDKIKKFIKSEIIIIIEGKTIKNINKRPEDRIKMC